MMYYHWISVLTYINCLHDEGIIEDDTFTNMKEHLSKLKYLVDEYDENCEKIENGE